MESHLGTTELINHGMPIISDMEGMYKTDEHVGLLSAVSTAQIVLGRLKETGEM